jgi:hypothetical protein
MTVNTAERILCRPLWKFEQKWAESGRNGRYAWWLRRYSYRHWLLGALVQGLPPAIIGPLLGYIAAGGTSKASAICGILAAGLALLFVPWFWVYNRWRARNGFE